MSSRDVPSNGRSADTAAELLALAEGRQRVLDRLVEAARRSEVGSLLLIGSLGRDGGDAWSDLDLIAVPGTGYSSVDLVNLFGDEVLATVEASRNAPVGGDYFGICFEVSRLLLWVDWYLWPHATATVPANATAIYDHLGLLSSKMNFIPLIQAHSDPAAGAHTDISAATLLRIAVAAKYLARGDADRLVAKVPGTQGLSAGDAATLLRSALASVRRPSLEGAVAATQRLVDLAEETAIRNKTTVGK